jgi:electron transfer flavoprotein alpha subunit
MDLDYLQMLMGEEEVVVEEEGEGYRNIWVVAERAGDELVPVTLKILNQARQLAATLGAYVMAVLVGGDEPLAQELIYHGADKVFLFDDPALKDYALEPYAKALGDLFADKMPEIVLFGATDVGGELAPRLARRLGTVVLTNCADLILDAAQRTLVCTVPAYDGEYSEVVAFSPDVHPQIVTVQPGAFGRPYRDEYRSAEVEPVTVDLDGAQPRVKVLNIVAQIEREPVPLPQARIVVSAGRGMGDAKGFALVEKLAAVLGGEVAGSRGAVDEGWIDEERQVGMGGATVRPDLYVACGISGAIQHYLGMEEAKFVVAINRDEKAPILKVADVGIVADAKEVIPAIIEAMEA